MEVKIIPCLNDNYSYLIFDKNKKNACVIDPSEYEPVIDGIENWWPKLKPNGVMFGDDFKLKSVEEAIRNMMPKLKNEGFSVNGSVEQTWFTGKSNSYKKFEKKVPGTNCLK